MSTGRLIGVVGPSGVGKDTVMQALCAARPGLRVLRRVITRPAGQWGEDFERVDEAVFEARTAQGEFALHWQAHGMRYGIPLAGCAPLAEGTDMLANLSRGVLLEAQARFPGFVTLALSAPHEVLAARIGARGREGGAAAAARLERAELPLPAGLEQVIVMENTGPVATTAARILAQLYPERGQR